MIKLLVSQQSYQMFHLLSVSLAAVSGDAHYCLVICKPHSEVSRDVPIRLGLILAILDWLHSPNLLPEESMQTQDIPWTDHFTTGAALRKSLFNLFLSQIQHPNCFMQHQYDIWRGSICKSIIIFPALYSDWGHDRGGGGAAETEAQNSACCQKPVEYQSRFHASGKTLTCRPALWSALGV